MVGGLASRAPDPAYVSSHQQKWQTRNIPAVARWTSSQGEINLKQLAASEEKWQRKKQAKQVVKAEKATIITEVPYQLKRSILDDALFLVDKPVDWTAFEVVKALKWALKLGQNRKIGHVGTMDVLSSGLLIVCTGDATKRTSAFHDLEKEYTGIIRLGVSTDTYDAGGTGTASMPWRHIKDESLQAAAAAFRGEVLLVPPMLSAIKVEGKPLHKFAEQGITLPREPRPVYIPHFSVARTQPGSRDVSFRLVTARGGFVRSLANAFGVHLGTASHLAEVRRERVGEFHVRDAWPLDVLLPLCQKYGKTYRDG